MQRNGSNYANIELNLVAGGGYLGITSPRVFPILTTSGSGRIGIVARAGRFCDPGGLQGTATFASWHFSGEHVELIKRQYVKESQHAAYLLLYP